jgi:dTDP-4-amino-4,6-dideoxygalactose transaminase
VKDRIISVANPQQSYRVNRALIQGAVTRVLESGCYILGDEVNAFEREFGAFLGVSNVIGVGSGTDALALALKSCGVNAGDEVITVSHTAVATVAAIEQIGGVPVFVDIDPKTRCLDSSLVSDLVTSKTKAVVPVHIYGQPAAMSTILEVAGKYGLRVIEDCAQAHGASIGNQQVGTFGDAAAFSFYPTKNLGAFGDGGAVASNDEEVANRCRWLRQYGWKERNMSLISGFNSRLDEIQAAILREKLRLLSADNLRRQFIACRYTKSINKDSIILPPPEMEGNPVYHLYVVECERREAFESYMLRHRIGTARHYPLPVHRQPAYIGRIRGSEKLFKTDQLYQRIVSLPMYPEMTDCDIDKVANALSLFGE